MIIYSVVYYSLEQMWKCEPLGDEVERIRNVKTQREIKRLDPEHMAKLDKRRLELEKHSDKEQTILIEKNKKV